MRKILEWVWLISRVRECVFLQVARELRVPVMLPSWVEAAWEEGLAREVHATEEKMVRDHIFRYNTPSAIL